MAKKLRSRWLYVAPQIKGRLYRGFPQVFDELNNCEIDCRSIDGKIDIYERQVEGWFLEPARKLLRKNGIKNSSFILLLIGTSYIEGTELYRTGVPLDNTNGNIFIQGMQRIFNLRRDEAGMLYSQLRGGLFHNGMTREMIIVSSSNSIPIDINGGDIKINHELFIKTIINDFKTYIRELRSGDETLRNNFDSNFSIE